MIKKYFLQKKIRSTVPITIGKLKLNSPIQRAHKDLIFWALLKRILFFLSYL